MDLTYIYLLVLGFFLFASGYLLPRIKQKKLARGISWSIILLSTAAVSSITSNESALFRMLVLVSFLLLAMKSIVMVESYATAPPISILQWTAFSVGWFGMRPRLFEKLISSPLPNISSLVFKAISRIIVGLFLLLVANQLRQNSFAGYFMPYLLMLVGLSFILHFGILNLSASFWRFLGVDVKELFRAPYKSTSLKEFWGKRWNMAFSEMTALIAYRPLKGWLGQRQAMIASFWLSGLLHEVAISVPVKAGYGLPLCYFALHALCMYAEEEMTFVKRIIAHNIFSHVWVFSWLLLPLPLLFHEAFVRQVIEPLSQLLLALIGC